MNRYKDNPIVARWFAGDLTDYHGTYTLRVLSAHQQVINLAVDGWGHLLALASPALYKGPAAICLEEEDFSKCSKQLVPPATGRFQPGRLELMGREGRIAIDWTGRPTYTFGPPPLPAVDPLKLSRMLGLVYSYLSLSEKVPASGILLGLEGGESYFRKRLIGDFPLLVQSLANGQGEQFALSCRRLCGLGRGATPTGDDLIHGALVAGRYYFHSRRLSWTAPAYPPGLHRDTTRLGGHMLEMARRGLTMEPVRNLLTALFTARLHRWHLNCMLEIGSSTGFDLTVAICYTLRHLLHIGHTLQLR